VTEPMGQFLDGRIGPGQHFLGASHLFGSWMVNIGPPRIQTLPRRNSGNEKRLTGKGIDHHIVALFIADIDFGNMAGVRTQDDAGFPFDLGGVRQAAGAGGASGEHQEEQGSSQNQLHVGEGGLVKKRGQAGERASREP